MLQNNSALKAKQFYWSNQSFISSCKDYVCSVHQQQDTPVYGVNDVVMADMGHSRLIVFDNTAIQ